MPRTRAPFWLAEPSRFASLSRGRARLVAAAIALLLAACLLGAIASADRPDDTANPISATLQGGDDRAETARNAGIVDGVRHGGGYYRVAADTLHDGDKAESRGSVRLPALTMVEAALPPLGILALFYLLALATLIAWYRRLAPSLSREAPKLVATIALACGIASTAKPDLVYLHETWAGMLLALSLALRRPDRWLSAASLGLAAALVCEASAPYLLLMAVFALFDGRRREGIGWLLAGGVFAIAFALHLVALARFTQLADTGASGWNLLSIDDVVAALAGTAGLGFAPGWLAAALVVLAIVGWAAWRDDAGICMTLLLPLAATGIAVLARGHAALWAFMVAPALLGGLVFVPDALRDLAAATRETRRITVRRVTR